MARDAGMGRVSLLGVVAGALVAYGFFVVLLAVASAVADAMDIRTRISGVNWEDLGVGGGITVAVVLFLAYLFGGYVAGRMARRAGLLNGALVFVFGLLVAVLLAAVVNAISDSDVILANLRTLGIPTTGTEWGDAATVAGIGSLLAMVLGAVLGGLLGERWHGKLMARAMDPGIGPAAEARAAAAERQREEDERAARTQARYRPTQVERPADERQPPPPPREERPVEEQPQPAPVAERPWGESRWGAPRREEPAGAPSEAPPAGGPSSPADREAGTGPRVTRRVTSPRRPRR